MKKLLTITIILLIVSAIGTHAAKTYIANISSLQSIELTKIKSEIKNLQEDNLGLSAKVLEFSSYSQIASRAAELGFASNKNIVSVYDPIPLALNR